MKTLILQRDKETQHSDLGTKGTISENGIKICDTLELHEENNKKRESHIPVGKQLCKIVNSPKFGKVYETVRGVIVCSMCCIRDNVVKSMG